MDYEFFIADVFTQTAFGGNQLAVFPDARGLSDAAMQALAREFNFSETTFVLPPGDPRHTCRVRIFTPTSELPFAGHPTVGTAAVLATSKHVDAGATGGRLVFEEGVGPVTVEVNDTFCRLTLDAPPFQTPAHKPSASAIAAALSLSHDDILDCWYAGTGLNFCYVHLTSADTVDRAVLDRAAWSSGIADGWSPHLYLFAGDFCSGGRLYARAFVPAVGVSEDPATGSACAGLVASLAQRSPESDGEHGLRIDQGVGMGRPSLIDAAAHIGGGRLVRVTVGGFTTVVGKGTMTVPDDD
jgi:trans-2,3-dihydro-3-hydroxyanthranilate isomerase